jgi:hypothetical protein
MCKPSFLPPVALLVVLATSVASCVSSQPGIATARLLDEDRPVDPREDNAAVLDRTVEGLVLQLEIDGDRVAVTDLQVMRVPKQPPRTMGPGMIGVTAIAEGRTVYTTAIPDEELNTEEQTGLVRLTHRRLTLILPTGIPVTALEVQLAPGGAETGLDLRPQLGEWCGEYRQQAWAAPWCLAAFPAEGEQR